MLSYRARRRLSLVVLLVGLPLWIVAAVTAVNWADRTFGRQPIWVELAIYVVLGVLWAFPMRSVFRGVGQADPDADTAKDEGRPQDRPS